MATALIEQETATKLGFGDSDFMQTEEIGPERAQEYLRLNTNNRNPSKDKVFMYASDMLAGRFSTLEGTIRLFLIDGETPVLIDGQQRLSAVIASKTSHPFYVQYSTGTRAEMMAAIRNIDKGRPRTQHDDLVIRKNLGELSFVGSPSIIKAAVTALAICDHLIPHGTNAYRLYSANARMEAAMAQSQVMQATVRAIEMWKAKSQRTPVAGYSAGFIATYRSSPIAATNFWERAVMGEMLAANDPIYLLRENMLRGGAGLARNTSTRFSNTYRLFVHAWNLHCRGEKRQLLRVPAGENFPALVHPREEV